MKRLLFIFALVCAPLAYGQGGVPASPIYFTGPTGRPLAGATITFCTLAATGFPCSPLASIFTNAGLTIASPNPVTTDGNGNIPVIYAAPGAYVLSVTGSGITSTLVTATVAGSGGGNVVLSANNAFTGNNTFAGTSALNGGGTLAGTFGGNRTDTGTNSHSGTETFTGLFQCKNFEGALCVDSANSGAWAGTDVGGWLNAAYAALPASGGRIFVAAGTYNYTTPISFGTNGKVVYLQCLAPSSIFGGTTGATVLNFTPTSGNALTMATGSGGGIDGCQLKGPGTGTGIGLNLSFAVKQDYNYIDVSGFGVNVQINSSANQAYLSNFFHAQIHDAVTNNLLLPTGASGTESVGFFGGIIHQNAAGFSATCIDLGTGADIQFYNVSFDQCGMTIRGTNPKIYIGGGHFEDPVSSTATAFITFDTSAAAASVSINGTKWVEDFASGRVAIIQANGAASGNITSTGDLLHSVTNPLAAFVALGASSMTATVIGLSSDGATITSYCTGGTACNVFIPTIGSLAILGTTLYSYGPGAFNFGVAPTPTVAGAVDIGTTAKPWLNLWLGTAATNNLKFQPAAMAAARVLTVPDPLGPVTMPYVIASGTTTLTANAALAAVTSQAANTTAAINALTTDAIEWSYATAPGAGDSLCHISPYVTAGNVNFVRTNPTAAAQNVSAVVINWRVIR